LHIILIVHILKSVYPPTEALDELKYNSQQALKLLPVSAQGCLPLGVLEQRNISPKH
jgi:hypothetical protein